MLVKKTRILSIIALGLFLFLRTDPVPGQSQSAQLKPSHSQTIEALDTTTLFTEANKRYKEDNYSDAAQLYEKLILSGVQNGELYYNLGNSYFKMGMLGKAILSYRLAELYLPRDQDLKTNLVYAREMTKDKLESRPLFSFLNEFCFWYSKLNLTELLIVFLILNGLCWALALIKIFLRNEYYNYLFLIILSITVIVSISLGLKLYHHYYSIEGVVVAKEISVRAGNGINNTPLFQLHDGAEFKIIEHQGAWSKIELGDGKRGWIENRWIGKCQLESWPALTSSGAST